MLTVLNVSAPETARASAAGVRDAGSAALRLVGGAAATVLVAVAAFLFIGNVLADTVEDPRVTEVREGRFSEEVYAEVEIGATKEALLAELRPVLPVDARTLADYDLRAPESVAAECVYFDREDGRAGQQYRFCFVDDVLVDKTVLLAGDPGGGSEILQESG